jgi:uncharacterized protein YecT (DUF1311 family)
VTRRLLFPAACAFVTAFATPLGISPAAAIDCLRASSAVEPAICTNIDLRMSDEGFNQGYLRLLDRLDVEQRRQLIAAQKRWLAERDALCMAKPATEVAECVRTAMSRREEELTTRYSAGIRFGEFRLGAAGQTLLVGHERLDVTGQSGDVLRLLQGNAVIAESQAPFEVEGRAGDDRGEAVVVSTHDFGNLGMSEQYLLWSLAGQRLHVEQLKTECLNYDVTRKGKRLELRTTASPGCEGVVTTWSAEGGLKLARSTEFSPKQGTTMAAFKPDQSPLDIEQFYVHLRRLAPEDWRAMARALRFATLRSAEDDKYLVLSPCSNGHVCQTSAAFAACTKNGKACFFAYEWSFAKVKYFPDRARWPADLTPVVDDWVKGEMRD